MVLQLNEQKPTHSGDDWEATADTAPGVWSIELLETIRLSRCLPEFGEVPTPNPASALTSPIQFPLGIIFALTQYSVALSTPQD